MPELWTAEEFAARKFELPDGGRGAELARGAPISFEPPDLNHGTAVMNLSKALAEFAPKASPGYACYELGIVVQRNPDTVFCPAISWFDRGERFAEMDKTVTDVPPSVVVEVVSTNSRRRDLNERLLAWQRCGVPTVWVVDPVELRVHVVTKNKPVRALLPQEVLRGTGSLEGFVVEVRRIFETPEWWSQR